jgi:putative addiction module component (TIGR02574 family)
MSSTTEQVFIEALALPTRERAALVHKLLISLEPQEGSSEIDAAWTAEALDRCKAYDEGGMTERESADVFRDAYKKVK